MNAAYFDQFKINKMMYLKISENLFIMSNLLMTLILILTLLNIITYTHKLIPNHLNMITELMYNNMEKMCKEHLKTHSNKYMPMMFTLFTFLTTINLLGFLPYTFTPTTHMMMTITFSLSMMMGTTITGFKKWKLNFLSTLTPQSAPLMLTPFLMMMETMSYLTRIMSLSMRLAANMSAGHLLFSITSSFMLETMTNKTYLLSIMPMTLLLFITLLELLVAMMQAYVFTLLTTMYLTNSLKLH